MVACSLHSFFCSNHSSRTVHLKLPSWTCTLRVESCIRHPFAMFHTWRCARAQVGITLFSSISPRMQLLSYWSELSFSVEYSSYGARGPVTDDQSISKYPLLVDGNYNWLHVQTINFYFKIQTEDLGLDIWNVLEKVGSAWTFTIAVAD